jgi:translation initiation factor IF-3
VATCAPGFLVDAGKATPGDGVAIDGGELPISAVEPRVNERIRSQRCRLIGEDGEQLGIFSVSDAQRIADDKNLDLVEVAPNSDPPVARIMDYGKYKYEEAIKAKKARKHQTTVQIKEIKFRPKIGEHDYGTKKKHVVRFLEAGAKVKVTIMFRGREMVHAERGLAILDRLAEEVRELALIETEPKLEGRNMHMLLGPVKKEPTKAEKEKAKAEAKAEAKADVDADARAEARGEAAAVATETKE